METFLQEDEEMLMKVRKHPIVYIEDILLHLFAIVVFGVGAVALFKRGDYGAYSLMVFIAVILLFWISYFYAWTKNYFDVWYVTNKHIIAINQKDILHREQLSMEYERIQDVFFEKKGFLGTFFGYGRVRIQSAGTEQELVLEDAYNAEEVARRIIELRDVATL
jgi:uncharacterized membrane protein YdbT with pleckstrin-like domain